MLLQARQFLFVVCFLGFFFFALFSKLPIFTVGRDSTVLHFLGHRFGLLDHVGVKRQHIGSTYFLITCCPPVKLNVKAPSLNALNISLAKRGAHLRR